MCPILTARELNCILRQKYVERSAVISLKYRRLLKFLCWFLDSMMGCLQIMHKFE